MTEQTNALTLPQRAALALNSQEYERKIIELSQASKSITEITNADGYQQCHAARMALKRERVAIEKDRKAACDDAQKFTKAAIAEERRLIALIEPEEERLQAIQDEWDRKKEEERRAKAEAERRRVAALQARIDEIRDQALDLAGLSAADIGERFKALDALVIDDSFQELRQQAEGAKATTLIRIGSAHRQALAAEEESRRLAAEREQLAREKAEQEAAAAAERARLAAERERLAEEQRRQQEEADRQEQTRKEAAVAEQRRLEALRAEQEAAAQAERDKLAAERAEADRIEAERKAQREAEEARLAAERAEVERQQQQLRQDQERARQEAEAAAAQAQEPEPEAPTPTPVMPFAAAEPEKPWRPTDEAILQVLSTTYNVPRLLVLSWLGDMDLQQLAREAA